MCASESPSGLSSGSSDYTQFSQSGVGSSNEQHNLQPKQQQGAGIAGYEVNTLAKLNSKLEGLKLKRETVEKEYLHAKDEGMDKDGNWKGQAELARADKAAEKLLKVIGEIQLLENKLGIVGKR